MRPLIEVASANLLFLQPDFDPIGEALAHLKALLRMAAEQTV